MIVPPRTLERRGARVCLWHQPRTVSFEGVLREPDVETWLEPLVRELHSVAVANALTEVVLDLRALSYANASVWRCLVGWLKLLRSDAKAKYKLRILGNAAHNWQKVGIPSLCVFGGEHLEVKGLSEPDASDKR